MAVHNDVTGCTQNDTGSISLLNHALKMASERTQTLNQLVPGTLSGEQRHWSATK